MSSKVYCLLPETVQFELALCGRNETVDFRVICDGTEDKHSWLFRHRLSRQDWQCFGSYRYSYHIYLSGGSKGNFKYEESSYIINVRGNNNVVLANESGDLNRETCNQMSFNKNVLFFEHAFESLLVEITFQSCFTQFSIQKSLKLMLDDGTLSDVVIKTADKEFPCHKVVLGAASEYFVKMFQVDMKEKKESVIDWIRVFEADVVQDFLHYVYAGYAPPNITNTAFTLFEMAHMLSMDDLKKLCTYKLKKSLTVENVGDVFRMAVKNESKLLQKVVINFIIEKHDFNGDTPPPWETLEPEFLSCLVATVLNSVANKKMQL